MLRLILYRSFEYTLYVRSTNLYITIFSPSPPLYAPRNIDNDIALATLNEHNSMNWRKRQKKKKQKKKHTHTKKNKRNVTFLKNKNIKNLRNENARFYHTLKFFLYFFSSFALIFLFAFFLYDFSCYFMMFLYCVFKLQSTSFRRARSVFKAFAFAYASDAVHHLFSFFIIRISF